MSKTKKARYMQNVATKIKLGNASNDVVVTNAHNYRTILSQIDKVVNTF